MKITIRVVMDRYGNDKFYDLINSIHSSFKDGLLDEFRNAPKPIETGEFQQSWKSHREDVHHTIVYNDTPQATFLQGTGIWGPRGEPFCAIHVPRMRFWWRADHYRLHTPVCVRGINPHEVHGYNFGDTYDFIAEMNNAIQRGKESALDDLASKGVITR